MSICGNCVRLVCHKGVRLWLDRPNAAGGGLHNCDIARLRIPLLPLIVAV